MIKKILNVLLLLTPATAVYSQDFLGISTGNYGGVTGVLLQPASIADSRYKFDINVFSTGVNYSNNYFLVNRDAILKFNKNNFEDYQTFKAKYLSEANLATGERAFFNITNRTQLPLSFMATLGKKSAVAFNMQSRSMIQGRNITQDLAQMAYNGFYYAPLNNQPLDASGLSINALNWVEAGLTYARVLYTSDKHFIKAAFTGKYLGGVASLNMGSDNFRIGVNTDSTINFTATNFRYNHNEKADFDMVFDKNFRPDASAFGFDAGLVYEYRGNLKNNRYIRNDDDISYEEERRDVNKYIFKLGVSLLDMGMFSFNKPANVQSFNANVTGWDVRNSHYTTIKQFDTALAARVSPIAGDPRSYSVYLPAALSVQLDIRFVKGFYLNAMAYRPLATGSDAGVRFDSYGYYAITPRYERRHFGIYLPYSFSDKNQLTNYRENRLGATVRVGPLFIGSSNLGTMLFKNNLSAADVHLGLKVGITYGKPSKISRFFERKHVDVQPLPAPVATATSSAVKDTVVFRKADTTLPAPNRIAVDYNKGLVYADDRKGSIIIINNNYFYDTSNRAKSNAIVSGQLSMYNADSATLRHLVDSIQQQAIAGRLQADTARQQLQDSIDHKKDQLDSLIRNLQQLRQQMDSSHTATSNDSAHHLRHDTSTVARQRVDSSNNASALHDSAYHLERDTSAASQRVDSSNEMIAENRRLSPAGQDTAISSRRAATDTTAIRQLNNSTSITSTSTKRTDSAQQAGSKKKIKAGNGSNAKHTINETKLPTAVRDTVIKTVTVAIPVQATSTTGSRDDLYQKYMNESARLQDEINALRHRASNNYNRPVYTATPRSYSYPVSVPQPVYNAPATAYQPAVVAAARTIRDTVYIRDTIRIKDIPGLKATTAVADTLKLTDTIYMPAKQPSQATVAKADTITEKINYRNLPAEIILFSSGQSTVRKVYNGKLNYLASILKKDTTLTLSITGHTDPTGPATINEALSLKRALAVKQYFIAQGIPGRQLTTKSVGSQEPLTTGTSKDSNSQNRRVEIKIQ